MDLFYFRGKQPNFGDELNHWMWPRLIQDCWDDQDNVTFVGIGSVLESRLPQEKLKIVFGSGYGGYKPPPSIDNNWKIFFVRGKKTAQTLGIDESLGIGDSAILLRSLFKTPSEKKIPVSFMPHWESLTYGNWELACRLAGITLIDPRLDVQSILNLIQSSELIITEAMHGAIVADAMRVPWIPLEPIDNRNREKWFDWASALNIELTPSKLYPSSIPEKMAVLFDQHNFGNSKRIRKKTLFLKNFMSSVFATEAANQLSIISTAPPHLSKDSEITRSHEMMKDKLHELIQFIGKGKVVI